MNKIEILSELIKDHHWKLAYYSLVSAVTSRGKLWSTYKFFSKRRFDNCKQLLGDIVYNNFDDKKYEQYISDNDKFNEVIWTMWYQGYENAPQIVKEAIDSKINNSGNHRVILIDKNNLEDFVEVPEWMRAKVDAGIISLAHLSDYARSALLCKYGGIWIDSTIFLVDRIPDDVFHKEFWSIHWDKNREWIASYDKWSVGVLASVPHSTIMEYCYRAELNYWRKYDYPITYLLLDMFIADFYEKNMTFRKLIDGSETNNTHIFDFVEEGAPKGNRACDEFEYSRIRKDTWMFQLTYKENYIRELDGKTTYFGRIREDGLTKH